MSAPTSAENTIRVHDQAIVNWLDSWLVDYGTLGGSVRNQVPCIKVFASPQRAFATTVDTLVRNNWISGASPAAKRDAAEQNWPVLPLPVISIDRDDPIISNELSLVPGAFRKTFFDPVTGSWQTYDFPGHYITQYRVTLWCEKQATKAYFFEWLMAQLGQRGAGSTEVMIPVQHVSPFGPLLHALRYLGSANLSDLEGYDARHIRSQLAFTLRSWFFRKIEAVSTNGKPVYSTGLSGAIGSETGDGELFPTDAAWGSNNLFTLGAFNQAGPGFTWPGSTGDATVVNTSSSSVPSLEVSVNAAADEATLSELPVSMNERGYALIGISSEYEATSPATLVVEQAAAPTSLAPALTFTDDVTRGLSASLFPTWNKFHSFAIVRQPWFSVRIRGADVASTLSLRNTEVRQIYDQRVVVPSGWSTAGSNRIYTWSGLDTGPCLVIATFTTSVSGSVSADFGDGTSLEQHSQAIVATSAGVAILGQPVNGTISLTIPIGCVVDNVFVQSHAGPYRGYYPQVSLNPYNALFVGTNNGLYAYSGGNWNLVSAIPATPCVVSQDIVNGTIYASTSGKIFTSIDRGQSWVSQDFLLHNESKTYLIQVFSRGTSRMWGKVCYSPLAMTDSWTQDTNGNFSYSDDGGLNWAEPLVISSGEMSWSPSGTDIYATDYGNIRIIDTTLGGTSVTQFITPQAPPLPGSAGIFLCVGDGAFWTSNAGSNLTPATLWRSPLLDATSWGIHENLTSFYPTFTEIYTDIRAYNPGQGKVFATVSGENQFYYYPGASNALIYTSPSGGLWHLCTLPSSVARVTGPYALMPVWSPAHNRYLAFYTATSTVLESTDGVVWTDAPSLPSGTFTTSRHGYVPGYISL